MTIYERSKPTDATVYTVGEPAMEVLEDETPPSQLPVFVYGVSDADKRK